MQLGDGQRSRARRTCKNSLVSKWQDTLLGKPKENGAISLTRIPYNIQPSYSKAQYLCTLNKCHMTVKSFPPGEYHFVKYVVGAMSSSRGLALGTSRHPLSGPLGRVLSS